MYWIIFGPVLSGLHTLSSIMVLGKVISKLGSATALGNDARALLGFALTNILIQSTAAITAYGVSIAMNYDEVIYLFNQIIHSRHILNGNSVL